MLGLPSKYGMATHFISGCFDGFHDGHRHILETAKHYGAGKHTLIAAINSNEYIRWKKHRQPLDSLDTRIKNVSRFADVVIVFHQPTPLSHIQILKPDRIFVGDDYGLSEVAGAGEVKEVVIVPRVGGLSTSQRT